MKSAVVVVFLLLCSPWVHGLCIKTNKANLRKGPGSHYPKTWTVGLYTPLIKLEKRNGWYKVKDVDGEVHWVYHTLTTHSYSCLTVRSEIANLRTGPGSRFPRPDFKRVDRYTSFKKMDREGDWFKVIDIYGKGFWIYSKSVWRPLRISNISF